MITAMKPVLSRYSFIQLFNFILLQAACRFKVRYIQVNHMDGLNYDDITYNFLIGGDEYIYVGRGFQKMGAHTQGYNSKSEGIAFIGNYDYVDDPTTTQMEQLQLLLEHGISQGYISKSYKIYASQQLNVNVPTGKKLIEALKKFPNFVDKTSNTNVSIYTNCMYQVKLIQDFHISPDSKNFSDIAYQFLVGGDGNAYEGRGWTKQGAHTKGFNVDSICIAFIGTFISKEPPIAQLSAAEQLIQQGLEGYYLASNYSLFGHRQLAPFESPGKALYNIIKTWPHWSNKLSDNHWVDPSKPTTMH
ncbi:peptidoglycan recognition protein 3-like [Anopheles nili]|uniref:peptidoglycan recognition protein 3-like n=1 Tax=Anopheles nili TaxID=185578 RepID=UPI00237B47FF|nr:peptidoglycan recognition protein 3-like [Anopheles nili]